MADIRETIRLNPNLEDEARIIEYLNQVQNKKKGAFIKDALNMYIQFIEEGLYKCPYIGEIEKEIKENKFAGLVNQTRLGILSNTLEEGISTSFDEIDKEYDIIINDIFR